MLKYFKIIIYNFSLKLYIKIIKIKPKLQMLVQDEYYF